MIKIGWSTRDVSTNEPVGITGQFHQRISKGCIDAITVTALVVEREDTAIILSGDFVCISDGLLAEVKESVKAKKAEIPTDNIIFSATHTHTSPRYMRHLGFDNVPDSREIYPPEKYRAFLVDQVSDAIIEAYSTRSEGSFAYGYGTASVGVSRRSTYIDDFGARENSKKTSLAPNGHAMMYGITCDDMFAGYEGSTDSSVYFMFTFDKNEKLTGAVINVPCPSQCGEHESYLSADYWTFARKLIREKYGNIHILPQCAAAGDLSPHILHAQDAQMRKFRLKYADDLEAKEIADSSYWPHEYYNKMDLGERVFHAFEETYPWASKEKIYDAPVIVKNAILPLDAWKITDEQYESAKEEYAEYFAEGFVKTDDEAADYFKNTVQTSILGRYRRVIDRYESGADKVNTLIHVVRIGDIAFASNPFELYIDYQHRIQGRSPFVQTFIVQLAAQEMPRAWGYLCTERAKANMGYSAIMYSCTVSPEGGRQLVDSTVDILKKLYD